MLQAVPGVTAEPIKVRLLRNTKGVLVQVECSPEIEEFFKELARGEVCNVSEMGRHWGPMNGTDVLQAHYSTKSLVVEAVRGCQVLFNRIGYPLIDRVDGYDAVNLSFLKLLGTSAPGGVTFQLKGTVMTYEALKKLQGQLADGCRAFFVNYLKPVELAVTIRTQEVRF